MKFYFYILIILIFLGFVSAGCTQLWTEKEETEENTKDIPIMVYKSTNCNCCDDWESQMTKSGFHIMSKTTDQMAKIKKELKVPEKLRTSCHTAIVEGFVIEGNVPADAVKELLKTRPGNVKGLAATESDSERNYPNNYDVFSFDDKGGAKVFDSY